MSTHEVMKGEAELFPLLNSNRWARYSEFDVDAYFRCWPKDDSHLQFLFKNYHKINIKFIGDTPPNIEKYNSYTK
jgi:hypothetical protein